MVAARSGTTVTIDIPGNDDRATPADLALAHDDPGADQDAYTATFSWSLDQSLGAR